MSRVCVNLKEAKENSLDKLYAKRIAYDRKTMENNVSMTKTIRIFCNTERDV